jgi:ATP-dependent helicase/nuclease subunit B
MTGSGGPRVFSIPAGVPFLETLARSLLDGTLVPGFQPGDDPLALADATIYVPTRRAARGLRSIFVEHGNGRSAILPSIRPLGDIDEDGDAFIVGGGAQLDDVPPIGAMDRLLLLAPLVRQWKHRIPAHLAQLYGEEVVVPASAADALWLARDLAALMDEVETEDADWAALAGLVAADHAGWWQLTLEFLNIVTAEWPRILQAYGRSNPAAHRRRAILAEARRLETMPRRGPIVAAGSTGSIPATAAFLAAIARHEQGAVVLPGLDRDLDARSWALVGSDEAEPQIFGHPQFGLRKLLDRIGVTREAVVDIGTPEPAIGARLRVASIAMRPADTTDEWSELVAADPQHGAGFDDVCLIEAANEREEAAAIAVALRHALNEGSRLSALVTGDRDLARRVSAELRRYGIVADDSAGLPLTRTPQAQLLELLVTACFRPGDPVPILGLIKHPLLRLGKARALIRAAADTVELVALRRGAGRPDIAAIARQFKARLGALHAERYRPFWWNRQLPGFDAAYRVCVSIEEAIAPLISLRKEGAVSVADAARATVLVMERLCRTEEGSLDGLYDREEGEALASFLRNLVGTEAPMTVEPAEWPQLLEASIATESVRPAVGAESRIVIWGPLEARLQSVDLMVIGSLNEGVWPRAANADRFMSRFMKAGMALEPPERRTGLAAHDFAMALGSRRVVLSRAARSGEAPAVASRWLQRLLTVAGEDAADGMKARGNRYLHWARSLDNALSVPVAPRPEPRPPLGARPNRLSVTEVETLRRDPYAVYARRILRLEKLDPLLRDPGALERGNLLHDILHEFTLAGIDPASAEAPARVIALGKAGFARAHLPEDIAAVWWPRFTAMVPELLHWERERARHVAEKFSEIAAREIEIGDTGVRLRGRADRIDRLADGTAEILDFKSGSNPSRRQAQTLVSPQLALEAALLRRGAFAELGAAEPADLVYVRLKANGLVVPESILKDGRKMLSAVDLAEDAWRRLEELVRHYQNPEAGYISRSLPFKEGDFDGDYDHLARVLEWSAGPGEADEP